ncbi:MAG: hypothetical protein M3463_01680, partial [Verrucomicrobiota bacterium]|nr:hypothetical protein [Verrucomicrobiota bacterium]
MPDFKNPFHSPLPIAPETPGASSRTSRRRRSSTTKLVIGIAILALLSALIVGARPAYRVIKVWRAAAMHRSAERLAAAQSWNEAVETLQAAYLLDPRNPAILRSIAELLTRFRQERALQFWERLVSENNAIDRDRLLYAELAVDLGRLDLAERQLDWLREKSPSEVGTLLLVAKIARAKNDKAGELTALRDAARRFPGSVLVELALQRALLESGSEEEKGKARAALLVRGREANATALSALEILARNPGDS